ncbi:MAG: FAD-binding oxidoreductase [Gammaproteobacteria bacterium]|nr:FAD-binding oxidoreductase [Gammaproteobacteria bacterium]
MLEFGGCGIVPGVARAQTVESDRDVPAEADVVVIGGGYLGCITALNLAERGVSVVLCEKGVVAGEASGRAVGLVEYELLSPVKMELIARSIELWHAMPERVSGDIGYAGPGLISLYEDEGPAEAAAAWLKDMQGQPGVDARMLTDREVGALDGGLGSGWHAALYQANGAAIEPCLAAPAIARAARAKGATLLQSCAVRSIERQGGTVAGVITEQGSIKTANVIIAGGVWSSMLAAHLGLDLPQIMIFAEQCSVEPVAGGPAIAGMTPAGYYRREPDGGYLFGAAAGRIPITMSIVKNIRKLMAAPTDVDQDMRPVLNLRTFFWDIRANRKRPTDRVSVFEENRILQPGPVPGITAEAVAGMGRYIPAFAGCKVREVYTGSLISTIDNLGVISPVASIPGLYIGAGMLYGLTMSAAAGEALADLVTGRTTKFDISPYRFERFTDGSRFVFHP